MKDNSKFWAVCLLIALGGIFFVSKEPLRNPNAPAQAEPAKKADEKLIGGVTKLQTQELRAGKGRAVKSGDKISVNYRGTLLDGSEFDSSYGKQPFSLQLGARQVIKGWDQGLVGMKEGGKRKLTIPASLGYGDAGSGEKIPGGATLVFEVELLKIEK